MKVLTDIDDTLYSSGGVFPAGVDRRYPRHEPYPGVTKFFELLEKGHESIAQYSTSPSANAHPFLSVAKQIQ